MFPAIAAAQGPWTTPPGTNGKVRIVSTAADALGVGCSGASPASTACVGGIYSGPIIASIGGSGTLPTFSSGTVFVGQHNTAASDNVRLTLIGGASGQGSLQFGTSANQSTASFAYSYAADQFTLSAGSVVIPKLSGDLLFLTDATNDVGASAANRPRDFWFSRNGRLEGTLGIGGAPAANVNFQVTVGPTTNARRRLDSTVSNGYSAYDEYRTKNAGGTIGTWAVGANITAAANSWEAFSDIFGGSPLVLSTDGTTEMTAAIRESGYAGYSADHTVSATEAHVALTSGSHTFTLTTCNAAAKGRIVHLYDVGSGVLTVSGTTSPALTTLYTGDAVGLTCDGSSTWLVQ